MIKLNDGQCGVCAHFGGDDAPKDKLVQLRVNGLTADDVVEMQQPCAHPDNAPIKLKVSPIDGCAGFTPAMSA